MPADKGSAESTAPSTRVVITDFGIARAVQLGSGQASDGPLTGGAAILGTPEYMAPEQVTGGTVTAATDIYAFGVVLYEMVTGRLPFIGDTPLAAAAKRLNEAPPRPEVTAPGVDARWSATVLRCLAREPEGRFKNALDILPELERPPRRWPRWAALSAGGLALALTAVAAFKVLPSLHKPEPLHPSLRAVPRPVLAILGFRDELATPELAWLPTALSESLGQELGAAETSLRVISGDRAASVRRSLGLSHDRITDEKARERMQGLLLANLLVYGTLKPTAPGAASVGLSVRMADAVTGHELVSLEEDLGGGAAALADTVARVAERLRQRLGVSLTQEESAALLASRERSLPAIRSYAQGVMSLRKFEFANAKSYLDAALAADGSFLAAQQRMVGVWEHEGNRTKAREAAERIRVRSNGLTSRQLAELDAHILSLGPEPGKGVDAWRALFDATPDDAELGATLVRYRLAPKTESALVSRLRALPAPASADIRPDFADATIVWRLGEPQRAQELLAQASARAQALGARTEMAQALVEKGYGLAFWSSNGNGHNALDAFRDSETLFSEVGEFDQVAGVKLLRGLLTGTPAVALKVLEDNAAFYRKLGTRSLLASALANAAFNLFQSGDYQAAASKLGEASAELEAIGEPPDDQFAYIQGCVALALGNMEGAWNAVRLARKAAPNREQDWALMLEPALLREQDRLPEARATLNKARTLYEMDGRGMEALGAQTQLCELACDEGHPQDGLDCLAKHRPGVSKDLWLNLSLAHCLYLAGDLQAAGKAADQSRAAAQMGEFYNERVLANSYLMRARAAQGDGAKAITSLRGDLAKAEGKHGKAVAFEVALALGEVELRAGRPEGRPRLLKLEREAKSREFFRIARLAREALDGKSAAAPGLR